MFPGVQTAHRCLQALEAARSQEPLPRPAFRASARHLTPRYYFQPPSVVRLHSSFLQRPNIFHSYVRTYVCGISPETPPSDRKHTRRTYRRAASRRTSTRSSFAGGIRRCLRLSSFVSGGSVRAAHARAFRAYRRVDANMSCSDDTSLYSCLALALVVEPK